MNVNCNLATCSFILNSKCVFYESSALPYTGIATNDSVEVALQKIEDVIASIISGGGGGIVQSITAGTGISVTGTLEIPIITNTLPDQEVTFTNGTGISVTGTYPNFTITNTSPSSGGTVTSVSGTANRITSTGGATPVIDISASYIGQTSITTLGTIATGVWQATSVGVIYGGTGLNTIAALSIWVANTLNTITTVTPAAGQSIRINAGGTAWEAYTPGGGGIGGSTGTIDNAVLRANGGGGSTVQSSTMIVDDTGNVTLGISGSTSGGQRYLVPEGSSADVELLLGSKGTSNVVIAAANGGVVTIRSNKISPTATNTVTYSLEVSNFTGGSPVAGIGAGLQFNIQTTSAPNYEIGATIEAVTTDITGGSEDFDLVFRTMSGGTAAGEKLRITSDGRLYGTALHNNAGAVTGTTNQYIASGTYTPTITNTFNCDSSTSTICQWMRVGNVVTVSGFILLDPTTGSLVTGCEISLPVASNLASARECSGTFGVPTTTAIIPGYITGETTNNTAQFSYYATTTTNNTLYFTFTYLIV